MKRGFRKLISALIIGFGILIITSINSFASTKEIRLYDPRVSESGQCVVFSCDVPDVEKGLFRIYRSIDNKQWKLLDSWKVDKSIRHYSSTNRYGDKENTVLSDGEKDPFNKPVKSVIDLNSTYGDSFFYKIVLCDYKSKEKLLVSNIIKASVPVEIPRFFKASAIGTKQIILRWKFSELAAGYQIYRKSNGAWKKIKTTEGEEYTDKNLNNSNVYFYKVRAYVDKKSGKRVFSDYSEDIIVRLSPPNMKGTFKNGGNSYGGKLSKNELKQLKQSIAGFNTVYIKKNMNTYQKLRAAMEYMFENVSYSSQTKNYNNAWGALVNDHATCYGYSYGYNALCDSMGIPCKIVKPNSKAQNPNHMWNMVKLGKKWYIVDSQAGLFLMGGNRYKKECGMRWNENQYPKCSAKDHKQYEHFFSIFDYFL